MRAILLDLDGTMVHSDPVHAAVFVELLAEHGRSISEDFYYSDIHGRQNVDIFSELLPGQDAAGMAVLKETRYRDRLDEVAEVPGLRPFLEQARAAGYALGVVTNAPRVNARAVLDVLGLGDAFDTLVIGDECARGKPDPLPYAIGLANLGGDPAQSFAVEDSPSGIRAAKGAGLFTFGMRSSLDHATLGAAGADATIADFNDTALLNHLKRLTGATQ